MTEQIIARRNDTHRPGEEVLVLRHQKLKKGYHPSFVEASKQGVWLVYEKIGTRAVFDYKVIYPEGGGSPDYDENYRLARYASYDHWEETRRPEDFQLSENGLGDALPVRYDIPVPGDEIAELNCWKINKGGFDEFDSLTRDGMLPVMNKMGIRGIGIWKLIYPETAIDEEHDE